MNRADVIALLGMLKTLDARGFVVIDDATIEAWRYAMNHAPAVSAADAMRTAQALIVRPGVTFPTPGDFRVLVAETIAGVPSVAEARAQVERALRENYPGMPARYTPDPVVLDAVRSIGGVAVFRASQSEQETGRHWRAFEAAYRTARDARVNRPAIAGGDAPALDEGSAA